MIDAHTNNKMEVVFHHLSKIVEIVLYKKCGSY